MAAGLDLKSAYITIPAFEKGLVESDLAILVPPGCYGRIAPRSGLAHHHISVGGGVIDADYRGNLCVIIFNHSSTPFQIRRGTGCCESMWLCWDDQEAYRRQHFLLHMKISI
jgi:dUTP pyrophosphatase